MPSAPRASRDEALLLYRRQEGTARISRPQGKRPKRLGRSLAVAGAIRAGSKPARIDSGERVMVVALVAAVASDAALSCHLKGAGKRIPFLGRSML